MKTLAIAKSSRSASRRRYHHGDLRIALLTAAWDIVGESGVEALTLRACARRVGVSHAAPEHHFGNLAGLLEEFAANGYERMSAVMDSVASEHTDQPLLAVGLGYLRFAETYPKHFRVMTTIALTSHRSTRLRQTRDATRLRLEQALRTSYAAIHGDDLAEETLRVRATLAWSCVHGYAALRADDLADDAELSDGAAVLAALRSALLA